VFLLENIEMFEEFPVEINSRAFFDIDELDKIIFKVKLIRSMVKNGLKKEKAKLLAREFQNLKRFDHKKGDWK